MADAQNDTDNMMDSIRDSIEEMTDAFYNSATMEWRLDSTAHVPTANTAYKYS